MPSGYVLKPIQERDLKVTQEMALYVSKADATQQQIEELLKESENRFQLAMAATSDGLLDWYITTNEIYFSPGYFTMFSQLSGYFGCYSNMKSETCSSEQGNAGKSGTGGIYSG